MDNWLRDDALAYLVPGAASSTSISSSKSESPSSVNPTASSRLSFQNKTRLGGYI